MKLYKTLAILVLSLFSCASYSSSLSGSLERDFQRLDQMLENADTYETAYLQRISDIKKELESANISLRHRYDFYNELYERYLPYKFDNAMDAVLQRERIAAVLGNPELKTDVAIDKALLLTTAGVFLEASQIISSEIDTLRMSKSQIVDYYNLMQRFCQDYSEYSPTIAMQEALKAKAGYYRGLLIDSTPKDSWLRRNIIIIDYINNGMFEQARDSSLTLISSLDKNSHEYAITCYYAAVASFNANRLEDALHWYVESSVADIRNAVKDNASLCCLAMELFELQEVDRAFKYIQISLADAQFYNSKVRPWQIAKTLPTIEKSYMDARSRHSRFVSSMAVILSLLVLLFLAALIVVIVLYVRDKNHTNQVVELNGKLQTALSDLSEANVVKEEYIGLFLSMCSNYLGKLKKLYTREQMDAELKTFYSTFDNAFVQLYPEFVQRFNSLLKPECQIVLKKGEVLNTELRIFALIKLGITQSSHIASLLRYSVNTIYNYRAQIKNAALENRENFEDLVRKL